MSELPNIIKFDKIDDLRSYAYAEKQRILNAAPRPAKYSLEDLGGVDYETINNQSKDRGNLRPKEVDEVKAESRVYKYKQGNYDVTVWANVYNNGSFDSNILMKGMVGDIEVNVSYSYSTSYQKLGLDQISFKKGQATVWTLPSGSEGFNLGYTGREPHKNARETEGTQILLKVVNEFAGLSDLIVFEGRQEGGSEITVSQDDIYTAIGTTDTDDHRTFFEKCIKAVLEGKIEKRYRDEIKKYLRTSIGGIPDTAIQRDPLLQEVWAVAYYNTDKEIPGSFSPEAHSTINEIQSQMKKG